MLTTDLSSPNLRCRRAAGFPLASSRSTVFVQRLVSVLCAVDSESESGHSLSSRATIVPQWNGCHNCCSRICSLCSWSLLGRKGNSTLPASDHSSCRWSWESKIRGELQVLEFVCPNDTSPRSPEQVSTCAESLWPVDVLHVNVGAKMVPLQ